MRLFLVIFTIVSCSAIQDTWIQFRDTGNYYMVHSPIGLNYSAASNYCNKLGASLASIHSKAENDFIYELDWNDLVNPGRRTFYDNTLIGLRISEGVWSWDDGTEASYANWMKDEPNDYVTGERCAVMFTPMDEYYSKSSQRRQWIDVSCERKFSAIVCKKEIMSSMTEPTTRAPITTKSTTAEKEANVTTFVKSNKSTLSSITNTIRTTATTMSSTTKPTKTKINASTEIEENITTESPKSSFATTVRSTTVYKESKTESNATTIVKLIDTNLPVSFTKDVTATRIRTTTEPIKTNVSTTVIPKNITTEPVSSTEYISTTATTKRTTSFKRTVVVLPTDSFETTDILSELFKQAESSSQVNQVEYISLYFNHWYTSLGAVVLAVVIILAVVILILKYKKCRSTFILCKKLSLTTDEDVSLVGMNRRREPDEIEGLRGSYSLQKVRNTYVY